MATLVNRYQVSEKIQMGQKIYQHYPFQGHPKYTQIGIFGTKKYHLATLLGTGILFAFGCA
jgi:hypothetical protein